MVRKIIHIDMDAFYASVEQRDNPEYRGKAIAVGGSPTGRGVVATASYEARKYGLRSAMSSRRALQLCPHVIFVRPRFQVYKEVSTHIREIFHRYSDLVEPLSLDEAYIDVTDDKQQIGSAIEIARRIKAAIQEELQLTASAGVSVNKFVAKVASDLNKPDGLTFISPANVEKFMEELPVEKFHGVGRVTAEKMKQMGLHTGADLKRLTEDQLTSYFGKVGHFYYRIVRGIDQRNVSPHREVKSVSTEDTFPEDIATTQGLEEMLDKIGESLKPRLDQRQVKGRTVTLKIKYGNFHQIVRSCSLPDATDNIDLIVATAKELLRSTDPEGKPVRLLGIGLSNFKEPSVREHRGGTFQLELFD